MFTWSPDVSKKSKRVSNLKKLRVFRLSALSKLRAQLDPANSPALSLTTDYMLHFSDHLIRKTSTGSKTSRRPLTSRSQTYSDPLKSPRKSGKTSARRRTKSKYDLTLQLGTSLTMSALSTSNIPVLERADVASAVVELGQSIIDKLQRIQIDLVRSRVLFLY